MQLTDPNLYRQARLIDEPVGRKYKEIECVLVTSVNAETQLFIGRLGVLFWVHVDGLELFHLRGDLERPHPIKTEVVADLTKKC